MLKTFWQKVSGKANSTMSRALKRSSILPVKSVKCAKEKLGSSQQAKIYETIVPPDDVTTFLSNEKSRLTRLLNERLKIPRRFLRSRVPPSSMILRQRNPRMTESDGLMGNLLLLRRDVVEEITTRLKRWKSTQSSCEKDNCSKKSPRCIEDHQQSADTCGNTVEKSRDGHQTSEESRRGSSGDLLAHREYYRSIESSSPIYPCKPTQYNDWRACNSGECSRPKVADGKLGEVTSPKCRTSGKLATEEEIHPRCRPKSCSSSPPSCHVEKEEERLLSNTNCDIKETEDMERNEPERPVTVCCSQQHSKSSLKEIDTLTEKEDLCAKDSMSRRRQISDLDEDQTRPDPPPPRQQHWTENPPPYCKELSGKTCKSIAVEPSPMIFVPHKGLRKSRAKDAESSCYASNAEKNECKADAETGITRARSCSRESSSPECTLPEDKCVGSPTPTVSESESKLERFQSQAEKGVCCAKKHKKEFVISDVRDYKPNIASLKYRLSKCLSVKETRKIADRESPDVVGKAQRKHWTSLFRSEKTKSAQLETERKRRETGKESEPRSGWARQRYKVRQRIFHKGDGKLDPCLPLINEVRQPRCEQTRPSPSSKLLKTAADRRELSPRSGSPCPSDYCPAARPVVETKSYPTKMEECRMAVRDASQKCTRKKRR